MLLGGLQFFARGQSVLTMTIDLQHPELADVMPNIERWLLAKCMLVRGVEMLKFADWSIKSHQKGDKTNPKHPIVTLRGVCKRFAAMLRPLVCMECPANATFRLGGRRCQSEPLFVDALMSSFSWLHRPDAGVVGRPLSRRVLVQFHVAVWYRRVAWVVANKGGDALAGRMYASLKRQIALHLGDAAGELGKLGQNKELREQFCSFFIQCARPLDKLADDAASAGSRKRKRRALTDAIQTYARCK